MKAKFNLKVFVNKKNGQTAVHLPKKMLNKIPSEVEIRVPKEYVKKMMGRRTKWN